MGPASCARMRQAGSSHITGPLCPLTPAQDPAHGHICQPPAPAQTCTSTDAQIRCEPQQQSRCQGKGRCQAAAEQGEKGAASSPHLLPAGLGMPLIHALGVCLRNARTSLHPKQLHTQPASAKRKACQGVQEKGTARQGSSSWGVLGPQGCRCVLRRLPALPAPAAVQLCHPARCASSQSGRWFHLQGILVTSELAAKITTVLFQQRRKCYSRILKTKQNKWIVLWKQLGGGRSGRHD